MIQIKSDACRLHRLTLPLRSQLKCWQRKYPASIIQMGRAFGKDNADAKAAMRKPFTRLWPGLASAQFAISQNGSPRLARRVMTMAFRTIALLWAATSLLALPAPAHELMRDVKTSQFDYEYVEPKNPEHRQIYETMKEKRVLENFQEFLSPLRLPIRITLKLEGCDGVANATFWNSAIKVCYEYIEYLRSQAPAAQRWGLTVRDSMIALVVDVFLHEVGHAVLEDLDIPFFGREEDAADYFATYLLLQFSKPDARRLILGTSFLGDAESMERHMSAGERERRAVRMQMVADPHSLPGQRYFNRLCMAYGADPALFADAISVGGLPESRAKHCRYEYQTNAYAFKILVAPYIDDELQQQVMARKWFEFETPAEGMDKPADTSTAPAGDGAKAFKPSNSK